MSEKVKYIGGIGFAKAKAGMYAISGLDMTTTFDVNGGVMAGDWEKDPVILVV